MHDHSHGADRDGALAQPGTGTGAQRRALRIALALNGGFLVVEVVGGVAFGSLALLADAGHMLTDVGALALALLAIRLAARPASAAHTYGLQRAELLAALANAATLALISAWIVFEAVRRFGETPAVEGPGMLTVAVAGLVVNVVAALILRGAAGDNLNIRGAFLHLAADALGSVGAIIAGIAVTVWGATWVDPAASLVIVVLIALSGWALVRDVVHVLLEGTPRGMDLEEVAASLHDEAAVDRVHHLHVWRLSSGSVALSAHVVAEAVESLHEAQLLGDRLKQSLANRFGIDHATLELECHDCREQQIVPLRSRNDPRPS